MKQNLVCSEQEKKQETRKKKQEKKKKEKKQEKLTLFFPSIYGSFCFTMFVFTFIFVPETKGRSLESMDELFGKVADGKTMDEEESRRGESHTHAQAERQTERQTEQEQNKVMDVNVAHVEKV